MRVSEHPAAGVLHLGPSHPSPPLFRTSVAPCRSAPARPPPPRRHMAWRPLPALWRVDGASMGRTRALLRTGDQGKGGASTAALRPVRGTTCTGLAGPPAPTRITLYYPHSIGRPASPSTSYGEPRRAVGPNHPFVGEWRAMLHCHIMVCDHFTHPPYLHGHHFPTTAHIPGIHTASARVRAPGGVTLAPSAPTQQGAGGGGLFCVRGCV